eukprot:7192568-Pyramimonas_sp.AAC.1
MAMTNKAVLNGQPCSTPDRTSKKGRMAPSSSQRWTLSRHSSQRARMIGNGMPTRPRRNRRK